MADLAHLAFQEMEVVEQPLGRGRDRLAMSHVSREDPIRMTEQARVVGQAAQQAGCGAPRVAREGEAGGQRTRTLFQAIDAEELTVQGAGIQADGPGERLAWEWRYAGLFGAEAVQWPAVFLERSGAMRDLDGRDHCTPAKP
jgi:hypothetical protein